MNCHYRLRNDIPIRFALQSYAMSKFIIYCGFTNNSCTFDLEVQQMLHALQALHEIEERKGSLISRVGASIPKLHQYQNSEIFSNFLSWWKKFLNQMLPSMILLGIHWYHLTGTQPFLADTIFKVGHLKPISLEI